MSKKNRKARGKRAIDATKLEELNTNLEEKLAPTSNTEIFESTDSKTTVAKNEDEKGTNVVDATIRDIQDDVDVLEQLKMKFGDRGVPEDKTDNKSKAKEETISSDNKEDKSADTKVASNADTEEWLYLRKEYDSCTTFADLAVFVNILKEKAKVDIKEDLGDKIVGTFITTFERLDAESKLHIDLLAKLKEKGLKFITICEIMSDVEKKIEASPKSYKGMQYREVNNALEVLKCWVK